MLEIRTVRAYVALRHRTHRSHRSFEGGVYLPLDKERTREKPIEVHPVPSRLCVPLALRRGQSAEIGVRTGQTVRCGEIIGRNLTLDMNVHAPADGVVFESGVCNTPHEAEMLCVVVDTKPAAVPHVANAASVDTIDALCGHVASAGLFLQDGSGRSLAERLRRAVQRGCTDLILNGMESEPCLSTMARILQERTNDVVAGSFRLARLLGVRRTWLALGAANEVLIRRLEDDVRNTPIELAPLEHKYPQGHAHLLIKSLLEREVPPGGEDLDLGVCVVDVGTVVAMESSIRTGMPVTHRLVTVSGTAADRPGNYSVALGTPIRQLIMHVGAHPSLSRIVIGGPMTGILLEDVDAVVTQRTTGVVLLGDDIEYERRTEWPPTACTRCGWCLEDCPVGLDPRALLHAAERRRTEQAARLQVHACIHCGLCSYVCPAGLPVAESIRALQKIVPLPRRGVRLRERGGQA